MKTQARSHVICCLVLLGSSNMIQAQLNLKTLQPATWTASDDTSIITKLDQLSEDQSKAASHYRNLKAPQGFKQHRRNLRRYNLRQTIPWIRRAGRLFVNVVIVAPSTAACLDRRTRLREQFPKNMQLAPTNTSAILKFAIGTKELASTLYNDTLAEDNEFSDVIFLDCIDADDALNWHHNWHLDAGTSSTTCKVMKSIQWAVKNFDFQYFFRLGDDSYLRIDKFLNMLAHRELPTGKAVIGQILQTVILEMDQQYAQGMGYALTSDVCEFIAAAAPWLLDTAPEDGVVARWLFAAGTKFVNHTAWRALDLGESCDENMVLAHKLPVELWSNITSDGLVEC